MVEPGTNWAGNVTFTAGAVHRPTSVDELRRVVAASRSIRALGTGHSFNTLVDSPGDLVSVAGLPAVIELDTTTAPSRPTVIVSAGLRYGELATELDARGYALHNLGSLPHISVAGACATGTHGSGDANGNLATAVSAVELVGPDGDLVALSRAADPDTFPGAVVALGALGIVTRLTLDVQPTYDLRQYVYDDLPGDELRGHFDEITASAYSVSLFTRWRSEEVEQVWRKERLTAGQEPGRPPAVWHGARLAEEGRHPLRGLPSTSATEQLGVPGPWYARLPHFRLEFTPSFGDELQAEYLLPREHAVEALDAVAELRDLIAPVLLVSEIRTVASDDLWLSPSNGRASVAVHFTWVKDEAAVAPVLAAVEEQLVPYAARPHWGKLFSTAPAVIAGLYPRMDDFARLRAAMDPGGKFGGAFVDRYLPGT